MKLSRTIALLLLLCMLTVTLVSCAGGTTTTTTAPNTPAEPGTPSEPTTPAVPQEEQLGYQLKAQKYKLIFSENVSDSLSMATTKLIAQLHFSDRYIAPDAVARVPQAKEIRVGKIDRDGIQDMMTAIAANRANSAKDWRITVSKEGTVTIVGATELGTIAALQAFGSMLTDRADQYLGDGYDSGIQHYAWELTALGGKPIAQYQIVVAKGASASGQNAAAQLQAELFARSGYTLPIVNDSQDEIATEFVIGKTNRAVSAQAMTKLRENRNNYAFDRIVYAQDTKISMTAANDSLIVSSVHDFVTKHLQADLTALCAITEQAVLHPMTIGTYDAGEYRIVHAADAAYETRVCAFRLQQLLKNTCGYPVEVVTDATAAVVGQKEILLGNTSRDASTATALDSYTCKIDAQGNLVIDAGHYAGVQKAVNTILAQLQTQQNQPIYTVNGSFSGTVDTTAMPLTWKADKTLGSNADVLKQFDFNSEYELVWSDEFEGDALDIEKWTTQWHGWPSDLKVSTTEKNVLVKDGELNLIAVMDVDSQTGKKTYSTAALLSTWEDMNFSGGYLEMRAKVPFKGVGEYSSFWLQSAHPVLFWEAYRDAHNGQLIDNGYFIEIDIFETASSAKALATTFHKWPDGKFEGTKRDSTMTTYYKPSGGWHYVPGTPSDWHTYSYLWTDEIMAFAIDGTFYYAEPLQGNTAFHQSLDGMDGFLRGNVAQYILIGNNVCTPVGMDTTWLGGSRGKYDEEKLFPNVYRIDYMRLYQTEGDAIYTRDEYDQGKINSAWQSWTYAVTGKK